MFRPRSDASVASTDFDFGDFHFHFDFLESIKALNASIVTRDDLL